ncbi:MAG: hypothetical protein AAF628_10925 [Planctomycetota bacterium]
MPLEPSVTTPVVTMPMVSGDGAVEWLHVLVVDAGGAPVPDVPVIVGLESPTTKLGGYCTDAEGGVRFQLARLRELAAESDGAVGYWVDVDWPVQPSVRRALGAQLAPARITLRLPPDSRRLQRPFVVRVEDDRGDPVVGMTVCLERIEDGRVATVKRAWTEGPDGEARFASSLVRRGVNGPWFYALERSLRVRCDWLSVTPVCAAVDPAAERVVLRLPPSGSLHVEVLDDRGQPVARAGARCEWRRRIDGSTAAWEPSNSGWLAVGEARLRLRRVGTGLEFRFTLTSSLPRGVAGPVIVQGPTMPGEARRAVITMRSAPADAASRRSPSIRELARGIVVDERGVPVRDARVLAWEPGASEELTSIKTDAVGRFVLRAETSAPTIALVALVPHRPEEGAPPASPMTSIAPGAEVALTVRARPSVVGGTVVMDRGVRPDAIRLRARAGGSVWRGPPAFGARFWVSVPPGVWDLQLCLEGLAEPLLEVPAVTVLDGDRVLDPRLTAVDLRGTLRSLRLRVRRQGGGAWRHEPFTLEAKGYVRQIATDAEGRAVVTVPTDVGPFALSNAAGCSAEFPWAAAEQSLVLPR